MACTRPLTRTKTHVRCGTPDATGEVRCPVGARVNGTEAGANSESAASSFDLEALTLTLLDEC